MFVSTRPNNGNDLIVDFIDRSQMPDKASTIVKKVSFSGDNPIRYFQYPSREEVSQRWHSRRDKDFFEQEYARDVQSIRRLLSTAPFESLEVEILYFCVGLESVISGKVTTYLKKKKRDHRRLIVAMQDCLNDEQLSEFAMSSSSQSRERAQKLASGYFEYCHR